MKITEEMLRQILKDSAEKAKPIINTGIKTGKIKVVEGSQALQKLAESFINDPKIKELVDKLNVTRLDKKPEQDISPKEPELKEKLIFSNEKLAREVDMIKEFSSNIVFQLLLVLNKKGLFPEASKLLNDDEKAKTFVLILLFGEFKKSEKEQERIAVRLCPPCFYLTRKIEDNDVALGVQRLDGSDNDLLIPGFGKVPGFTRNELTTFEKNNRGLLGIDLGALWDENYAKLNQPGQPQ